MSLSTPKPWEHKITLGVDTQEWDDGGGADVIGLRATCSCGHFELRLSDGSDPAYVATHTQPHLDQHPLPPHATAQLGDDSVLLVMAVPGPSENAVQSVPVHMTISVPKNVYDDGELLGNYIGFIGSRLHFQLHRQRPPLPGALAARRGRGWHPCLLS